MAPSLRDELDWNVPLRHRKGGATRLAGLDVYYDFEWLEYMKDRRAQFKHGQCLAERVREDCPDGKIPALLLTDQADVDEGARDTPSYYVVVLNLPRYIELAEADAAVSYLARALGPQITRVRELEALASADISTWLDADESRVEELHAILAERSTDEANTSQALAALGALGRLDPALIEAVVALAREDSESRFDLLRGLTEDRGGRFSTAEALGERTRERSEDVRRAAQAFSELVAAESTTETTLQRFLEDNPWLLGLDYSRVLPRRDIPRGTVDFLLARFDGFYDLLELKSPQDRIIIAPEGEEPPPSASKFSLSSDLAQALAQVHVYRDALRHDQVVEEQFGLRSARDPRVLILIGRADGLPPHSVRALRELNRSLHRVEVVPYDVLAKRANTILDNVEHYLTAADANADSGDDTAATRPAP